MRKRRGFPIVDGCLAGAFVVSVCMMGVCARGIWLRSAENRTIAGFADGHDSPLERGAPAALRAARGLYLLSHGRVDEAQTELDQMGPEADPAPKTNLLYGLANAHLRRALEVFSSAPIREVAPLIGLARSEFHKVISRDPDNWDARFNFDIASGLTHDAEEAMFMKGDDMARERALVPDAPGAPNGLP